MAMNFQFGNRRRSRSLAGPASLVGKLFTTAFLSIFVIVGCGIGFFALSGLATGSGDQGDWVARPGTVVESRVEIDPSANEPYVPVVTYTYTHGGRDYTGDTRGDDELPTNDYREAQDLVLAYPAASQRTVYVDPNQPADSTVEKSSSDALFVIPFMIIWLAIFSGVPLLIIINLWRNGGTDGKSKTARRSRDRSVEGKGGRIFGILFGLGFTAAGIGALIPLTILPLARTAGAQNWTAVTATVERSELLSYSDSDGTTYRIDILYFYEVNGQRYGSNRYSFSSLGSSSGSKGKRDILNRYPVGSTPTVYVDPDDPANAVLHRGLSLSNLWGLFPLPFLAVGLAVLYGSVFGGAMSFDNRRSAKGEINWLPGSEGEKLSQQSIRDERLGGEPWPEADDGPTVLKPGKKRLGTFVGLAFFALFWNGIVSIFVYQLFTGFTSGDFDICLGIFLIPFVAIGLGVIVFALRSLLLIFAPHVVVEIDRKALPLGGSTALRWHISGGRGKVSSVEIRLLGEESATYSRGTDSVTETETFYESVIVGEQVQTSDLDDRYATGLSGESSSAAMSGEGIVSVPLDTMHSFEGGNNRVHWKLEVKAKVKRWPDPKDGYDLVVLPLSIDR